MVDNLNLPVPLEQAARCPKCDKPGQLTMVKPVPIEQGGGHVNVYNCDNDRCVWGEQGSGWIVQTDERGFVFERDHGPRGMDKDFPKMSPDALARGRRNLEDVIREEHIDRSKKE